MVVNHLVLVGYGRVGAAIGKVLIAENIPFIVIEENKEIAERLSASGISCVYGDAHHNQFWKERERRTANSLLLLLQILLLRE